MKIKVGDLYNIKRKIIHKVGELEDILKNNIEDIIILDMKPTQILVELKNGLDNDRESNYQIFNKSIKEWLTNNDVTVNPSLVYNIMILDTNVCLLQF